MFYVPDRVDFTTSQVRMPKLSEATLITHNKQMSPKRPQELRQKAILNHAYSNPQCNMSNGLYIRNHKFPKVFLASFSQSFQKSFLPSFSQN